jgi:flotillin
LVVTGLKRRVITGSGGFVVPFFEITDRISLEIVKVEVRTQDSLDCNGVPIDTDGVAIVKVCSNKET